MSCHPRRIFGGVVQHVIDLLILPPVFLVQFPQKYYTTPNTHQKIVATAVLSSFSWSEDVKALDSPRSDARTGMEQLLTQSVLEKHSSASSTNDTIGSSLRCFSTTPS